MSSTVYAGHALLGEDLEERSVRIHVESGRIACIEEARSVPEVWICPAFFNAHTHVGDTVAMDIPLQGSLDALVAPPHGLKHRILAATDRSRLIAGMRSSLQEMLASGTHGFADFREGGAEGVLALRSALAALDIAPVILGREGGERESDGIGIAGIRDVASAEALAEEARRSGKLVAIHAGERDASDVDRALALEPDLLVHCTHATDAQLAECADRDIPIAVCPRSNWILGVAGDAAHPPLRRMQEIGCTLLLGTDNVMFVQPDMFAEMSFAHYVYRLDPRDLIRAAVLGSRLLSRSFFIEEDALANFLLIDPARSSLIFSADRCSTIVKRVTRCNIEKNVICTSCK